MSILDDPEMKARIAQSEINANKNSDIINGRFKSNDYNERLEKILFGDSSKITKFYALWKLADEYMENTRGNVACHKGCSHCCYIGVAITVEEAEAVGKRIGRAINPKAQLRPNVEDFDFGYHNPCTFLKDDQCSIYEHRPIVCRTHANADDDNFLCRLIESGALPVPYINNTAFLAATVQISYPKSKIILSDIRDFFPVGG